MRHFLWLIGWAVITPVFAQDEAGPKLPTGPAPTVARARFVDSALTVTEVQTKNVTEQYTVLVPVKRMVNGQVITEFVTEVRARTRAISVFVPRKFTTDDVDVYDLKGQKIPEEKLALQLKKERLVLITKDGKPLPKAYQSLYRADVLVVVPKKPAPKPAVRRPVPNRPDPMRG